MTENQQNRGTNGTRIYKLVVLGEGGVGKSALTMQFVSHVFLDFHDPTIEDAYQAQVVIDGEVGMLDILDTAGQEEFTAMREQYMRHGEGFVMVYSIIDRHSFQRLRNHISVMQRVRHFEKVPVVLVGNKLDLEEEREVTRNDGLALARELDCPFFEASAAVRQNVEDIFLGLVREIRRKNKDHSLENRSHRKGGRMKRVRKFVRRLFNR